MNRRQDKRRICALTLGATKSARVQNACWRVKYELEHPKSINALSQIKDILKKSLADYKPPRCGNYKNRHQKLSYVIAFDSDCGQRFPPEPPNMFNSCVLYPMLRAVS